MILQGFYSRVVFLRMCTFERVEGTRESNGRGRTCPGFIDFALSQSEGSYHWALVPFLGSRCWSLVGITGGGRTWETEGDGEGERE